MLTRLPVEPGGEPLRLGVERRRGPRPGRPPGGTATTRRRGPGPSSRRSGRPTRRWCRRCRCGRRASHRAGRGRSHAPSNPSRSGRAPEAERPTGHVGAGVEVVGQHPPGSASVERRPRRAPTSASACSHRGDGATEPPAAGPPRCLDRSVASHAPHQLGVALACRDTVAGSPQPDVDIAVHCGREIRQWPPLRPRTMPALDTQLGQHAGRDRDVGAVGLAGRHDQLPWSSGSCSRSSWAESPYPVDQSAQDCAAGRPRARPRRHRRCRRSRPPWPGGRRSWSATRALALPHAAGSRSRGKTNRVRRIASCLTRLRSS